MMFVIASRIALAAQAVGGPLVRLTVMVVLLMSATSLPASSVGRFHQPTFIVMVVQSSGRWPVAGAVEMMRSRRVPPNRKKSRKIAKNRKKLQKFFDM
jgi:hypothetical protein